MPNPALLLLVAIVVGGLASAPTVEAAGAWELVHRTTFDWREPDQRRDVAEDLLRRVDLLGSAIPPQSPKERARVQRDIARLAELAPGDAPREQSSLYLSRPYQHYRLAESLVAIRTELECVLAAADIEAEMACWARASATFLSEGELTLGLATLRSARMMPDDGNMPVLAQDPIVWYPEYGRGIVQHIVAPYLTASSTAAGVGRAEVMP
jgi:hypothetical protein